jgi:nucleotide-binding universal stress UspA family protein
MRNLFRRAKKTTQEDHPNAENGVTAATIDAGMTPDESGDGKVEGRLVVMGNESMFSSEVVEYAIDMAQRMSYEILALNSAPLSCDSFSLFSTSRSKICQEFQSISEQNAADFRKVAEEQGIPFVHVVKFDEPEQALASLQKEYDGIEFVIADAQPQASVENVAESNRPKSELLVYSMI